MQIDRNVMVPMRDGIHLATDIHHPAKADGPRPVILLRTPYNKLLKEQTPGWFELFARHGYVAVAQDCRGCYASEGDVDHLWPEAEDGYDTLEWIVNQDWCDGRIATWGVSWSGWTQTAASGLKPPGLVAMVPTFSGARALETSVRHHGAFELRFLGWAFWHAALNERPDRPAWIDAALKQDARTTTQWLHRLPLRRGDTQLSLTPAYENWLLQIATESEPSERWDHPSVNPLDHVPHGAQVPTLIVGSWYDSYTQAAFQLFNAYRQHDAHTRLLMGPWVHGSLTPEQTFSGAVDFGQDAALPSFAQLHLDWFDHHIRGLDRGLDDTAPIRLFVMGGGDGRTEPDGKLRHGGRWRDEHEWPLARTQWTSHFLHADGTLTDTAGEASTSSTTYLFDPNNPVPTIGGCISSLLELKPLPQGATDPGSAPELVEVAPPGGFDQVEGPDVYGCKPPYLPLASRADVLVFQTQPLQEQVEVTGPIRVVLWVSSSAMDTDFTAKLIDVYPPSQWHPHGYALNLTDSILRLRYREGGPAVPYEPNTVVKIELELYPTSNLFAVGHRIRLDVSSSNFPRFDVNPNTGDPLWTERRKHVAENTIYHDAQRPSHVVLPVVPAQPSAPVIFQDGKSWLA